MLGNDFTRDRMTGFYNVLGLIEYDFEKQSGSKGVIIAMAINNLRVVNEKYGKETGDIYVLILAMVLRDIINKLKLSYPKTNIFRSSANEYLLLIPEIELGDSEEVLEEIQSSYKDGMVQENICDASLNIRRVSYTDGISGLACLFKWLNLSFFKSNYTEVLPSEIEDWTDKLIERIIYSFKENLSVLREIDLVSLSDDISKLPNHRAAEMYLMKQVNDYKIRNRNFSVLFIDGDNLKRYNQLGYQYGNQMIEGLSKIISNSIRENDRVFRWLSGDEFLVILGDTELEEALNIAERVRYSVEQNTKDWRYPITISVGVANCPQDGINAEMIVGKAEKANLKAKASGKNKVVYC